MGGGAWPFLVGGVICLLNCVNERDLNLLNRLAYLRISYCLLRGTFGVSVGRSLRLKQVCDALRCSGQHVCYIDGYNFVSTYGSVLFKFVSLRGWIVVVFVPNYNVECLVSVHQQFVLNMSLFFAHTARRSFRF